ncbi:ATP-binding protein [Thermoflexus hugenholtzii]
MASLKPWHQVAVPREDLRKGVPLDAAEFAIHLDQVIDGRAPRDYRDPERFFARTYFTKAYRELTVEVLRRLAGEVVGTSPGINLVTQFGGGKTHFLTLLYHLFKAGDRAKGWPGVRELLKEAGLRSIPQARVGVFVGNRFDFVVGAGGEGEPRRRTPWGDLAWQLGGPDLYATVARHDQEGIVPGGEIIQRWFGEEPVLILMDEVLNFIRRARDAGGTYARLGSQMYSFLEVLSREAAGTSRAVLVVALPMSEYEMTPEDEAEFQRLNKALDRLSKPALLSEGPEIAEIVRRRLFEEVGDPEEIRRTAQAYAEWLRNHRQQIPEWFPVDQAEALFAATYPFHPTVLSVFERKWQSLPRFQRTRGILRLLALWASRVYQQAFREGSRDPLITLGSAPLADRDFRAAVFEQLGEDRLEAAILSDIAGEEAHAVRLDEGAVETLRKARLHQKVAATVFFESSGGQARNEATLPEIRLAVGEPGLDIGNIETALENLVRSCYYLHPRGTAYWISYRPNLNKILADRRASLSGPEAEEEIRERVRQVIRETFRPGPPLERRYFPESPTDIPDVPSLTLVVMAPEHGWENALRERTHRLIMDMIQHYRGRGRTYKSGLLFIVAEGGAQLFDEAKTLRALESLEDPAELERYKVDDRQIQELQIQELSEELREKKRRTERNLKEGIWRAYRRVLLLGEENELREVDLGLLHPSAAESMVSLIVSRLKQQGLLEETISPDFLVRHWPPALEEWSTKAVRDAFFASPSFPRLLNPEALKETIARGVREGKFGYASRAYGEYRSVAIGDPAFKEEDVELSEEVVLIPREKALGLKERPAPPVGPEPPPLGPGRIAEEDQSVGPHPETTPSPPVRLRLSWRGALPPQKWTQFYMKVLTHFATDPSLRLDVGFEVELEGNIARNRLEEIQAALRELGLDPDAIRATPQE